VFFEKLVLVIWQTAET